MHSVTIGFGDDIVFLHGWGGDTSAFLFFAEQLSARYRCTLIDFPGFGRSPEPERPYTVGDYADEVLRLMDEKSIGKAVFVGHSFGGRVAMEIAAKHPQRATALALVDSAGIRPRRRPSYYLKVFLHKLLRKLGGKGLKGSSDYAKLSPLMKETFKLVVGYDQSGILKSIKCPTSVFWGTEDRETPPYMAKKIAKGIKDSHIFWLDGGHFAYLFCSAAFLSVLSAFLDGVTAKPPLKGGISG